MSPDNTSTTESFEVGEFVELEYTARVADGDLIVDTTDPTVAAEASLADIDADGAVVVILGAGHVFEPVEDALTEMESGERRTVRVDPADAFGTVDPSLRHSVAVEMLPDGTVERNDRVSIDGRVGYVDAVEDGTATVDFNHPLAGSTLEYDIRTGDRVADLDGQTSGLLRLHGLEDDVRWTVEEGIVTCSAQRALPPTEDWSNRKRQFLESATTHLDVDAIQFEERYSSQ